MRIISIALTALVAAVCSVQAHAAKPLFESEAPIQAVLSAPIAKLYKERKKEVRLYREGSISYKEAQEQTHRLSV
mgnify:CR=1 FL=1